LRQGIFDQKSWDEKEEEKLKPNPTFRIRWGPGDVLIHPSVVRMRALNEGSISLTKLPLSAIENVRPTFEIVGVDTRTPRKGKHRNYLNDKLNTPHLALIVLEFQLQHPHHHYNSPLFSTRRLSTQAQFVPSTNTNRISGTWHPSSSTSSPLTSLKQPTHNAIVNGSYLRSSQTSSPTPSGTTRLKPATPPNVFSSI